MYWQHIKAYRLCNCQRNLALRKGAHGSCCNAFGKLVNPVLSSCRVRLKLTKPTSAVRKNKHEHKKLKASRGAVGKAPVLGMRERGGRVKAMPVATTDKKNLHDTIKRNAEAGAVVFTDEHRGYLGLADYQHSAVKHPAKEFVNGMAHTNRIESVWVVLKRRHDDTYHHNEHETFASLC